MRKHWRALVVITLFVITQVLYVFATNPCVSVSDEYTYKQIAYDIYCNRAVSTFHYPFLYPLVLSASFIFGDAFYLGMLATNILVKSIGLILIYLLLYSMDSDIKKCTGFLFIISITPIYYLYSDWIMAENLYAPLFVCTLLFYIKFRPASCERITRKLPLLSVIAGLLSILLYEVKYLSLAIMPVLFVFWLWGLLKSIYKNSYVSVSKKIGIFALQVLCYALPIIVIVFGVVIVYSHQVDIPVSSKLIKDSLGFSIGSGPENTGYKVFPEIKWILSYMAYAFLCAVLPFYISILKSHEKVLDKIQKEDVIFLFLTTIAFIYVAARHSSFVDYNSGGRMLKLLGRYVSYCALSQIMILWVLLKANKERMKNYLITGILIAITVFSYLVLYVRILWNPEEEWLYSLRGLDNAGFLKLGWLMVGYSIIAIFILFWKSTPRVFFLIYFFFCFAHIVSAIDADEYYVHDYIRTTDKLVDLCGNRNISVYAIDNEAYLGSLQSYSFLFHNQIEGDIWFLQAGFSANDMLFPEDSRERCFVLNKSQVDYRKYSGSEIMTCDQSDVFYYFFNEDEFDNNTSTTVDDVLFDTENVYIKCEVNPEIKMICVVDNCIIVPREVEDNYSIFRISNSNLGEESQIMLYDFTTMNKEDISVKIR